MHGCWPLCFNEHMMFRSAACAHIKGYKGNVSENDGPVVHLESDVRYRVFGEKCQEKQKNECLQAIFVCVNSKF